MTLTLYGITEATLFYIYVENTFNSIAESLGYSTVKEYVDYSNHYNSWVEIPKEEFLEIWNATTEEI